jgi:photosystem II stability/assembly factor-like uncharacterized protein
MTATAFVRSAVITLALAAAAARADWTDPALADAEPMPQAASALVLDVTVLDDGRLVAVGERGHVLLSDDRGGSWRQAPVPTRATLTAVAASGDVVIAAGHDGVIVRSTDAGDSWTRVREDVFDPDSERTTNGAPLLDVLMLDGNRALAIGAYSLMLASSDAGASWTAQTLPAVAADAPDVDDADGDAPATGQVDELLFDQDELMLDAEDDPHLNAIARLDAGRLFIVAERGASFLSDDDGASWTRRPLPYDGSMFGLEPLGAGRVLAYGLRGNALVSDDNGENWRELDTGTDLSLYGAARVGSDGVLLVGANGLLLRTTLALDGFSQQAQEEAGILADALDLGEDGILLLGELGLQRPGQGAQP